MDIRAPKLRWLRIVWLATGLGLLAGAAEMVEIVSSLTLSLTPSQGLLLAAACSGSALVVACCIALPVGLVVQVIGKGWRDSRALAGAMSATSFLLAGFYLWNTTSILLGQGRVPAAISMALCPIGVAGVVWFNAGYWLRRDELGARSKLPWPAAALIGAALVGGGAGLSAERKHYGNGQALLGDPNVLVISIDTLRRDHVGAMDADSPAATPHIDALANDTYGVAFLDATTPLPETGPAHAALFTGRHPLRVDVLDNGDSLNRGYVTVTERLEEEGWATGAFVSSFAVAKRSGLDQGFQLYDDDFVPGLRGGSRVLVVQYLMRLMMVAGKPELVPWMLERDGQVTVDLADGFIRNNAEVPWFTWVHLFEPHAPYEAPDATVDHRALMGTPDDAWTPEQVAELRRLYALEVTQADALVGQLVATLQELDLYDNTLIVIVSDHGEQLGEHGIHFHHHGLYDESIRVPLVLHMPGKREPYVKRVAPQVRMMDITPTILKYVKLDPLETEGFDLYGYTQGVRELSLVADLVGRTGSGLDAQCLAGLRTTSRKAPKEGQERSDELRVKYIYNPGTDVGEFFNLSDDPGEQTDISAEQTKAVAASHNRVLINLEDMDCGAGGQGVSSTERQALEALGYIDPQ